jgi:hypothetical protein
MSPIPVQSGPPFSCVLQYGLARRNRTLIRRVEAYCDTFSPYPDCFVSLRRALLLLRCEPAFRLLANTAYMFLGFTLLLLLNLLASLAGIEPTLRRP